MYRKNFILGVYATSKKSKLKIDIRGMLWYVSLWKGRGMPRKTILMAKQCHRGKGE